MRVEPLVKYRVPKYPRIGEGAPLSDIYRLKNKALIAALVTASGALSGCFFPIVQGEPGPSYDYLNEQEIIQILLEEAGKQGLAFDARQDITAKYSDIDIILDLYNEEKQIGAALIDGVQASELYNTQGWENTQGIYSGGMAAKGGLDAGQPVDFFLASEYIPEYSEEDLRKNFRDFLEWLHDNGII